MKGYIHKGIVKTNGFVDRSEIIIDPSELEISLIDDSYRISYPERGNFEWWYFDIIDTDTGCVLKLVAHLGTDPLRKRFFPQIAISARTPTERKSFITTHSLSNFSASRDLCDVRIRDQFHAFVESPSQGNLYHVTVNMKEFRCDVTFIPEIEGWKPLGDKVNVTKGRKKGAFSWVIPVPKAKVVGEFSLFGKKYELREAIGYHDHNYWEVDVKGKLFMDDAISKWYWGRFFSKDYAIIFMETYLKGHSINSLMIARQDKIIFSANNLINVFKNEFKRDNEIKTLYPSKITIKSIEDDNPFQMTLQSREILDKRDLLDGVNTFIRWLIKWFVSRPAYYGILADATIRVDDKEVKGRAVYELMSFRNKGERKISHDYR